MLAPVLICLGVFGFIKMALFNSTPPPRSVSIASGTQSPRLIVGANLPEPAKRSYNALLVIAVRRGRSIPEWLVNEAMREAFEAGAWDILRSLSRAFDKRPSPQPVIDQPSEPSESEPMPDPIASGTQSKPSPIMGVDSADWSSFVNSLETKPADYKDAKHVGAYYHHKNRLTEIGISPDSLTDKDAQYRALEADVKDAVGRYRKLINEWSGDVLTLNGQQLSITRSGILGLIKSAGPDGAIGWLTNDQQRAQYPKTTEMFLATNGHF